MDMSMMSTTAASAATASSTSTSMGGMSMGGMGSGDACKVSMLWNWYTVDACFISSSWHITSSGMFAGSCIGVILLTMSLAFLRRVHRNLDAQITSVRRGRRPNILQQAARALLHMTQFAVAYFVMLLAMYFNGYIIICILIGAFLGYFAFEWEALAQATPATDAKDANEVTGCCG